MTFYKHRHNQKLINVRTDGLFSFTFVKQTTPQERNIFLGPIRIGQALTNITKYRQEIASIVLLRLYFFIKKIQKKATHNIIYPVLVNLSRTVWGCFVLGFLLWCHYIKIESIFLPRWCQRRTVLLGNNESLMVVVFPTADSHTRRDDLYSYIFKSLKCISRFQNIIFNLIVLVNTTLYCLRIVLNVQIRPLGFHLRECLGIKFTVNDLQIKSKKSRH